MTPGFDNPAVIDCTDPIGHADGAKAMSDHNQDARFAQPDGASLVDPVDCVPRLRLAVECHGLHLQLINEAHTHQLIYALKNPDAILVEGHTRDKYQPDQENH